MAGGRQLETRFHAGLVQLLDNGRDGTMLAIKWFCRLLCDTLVMGIANRSPWQSLFILVLVFVGLLITASQVSAPFIYTLF